MTTYVCAADFGEKKDWKSNNLYKNLQECIPNTIDLAASIDQSEIELVEITDAIGFAAEHGENNVLEVVTKHVLEAVDPLQVNTSYDASQHVDWYTNTQSQMYEELMSAHTGKFKDMYSSEYYMNVLYVGMRLSVLTINKETIHQNNASTTTVEVAFYVTFYIRMNQREDLSTEDLEYIARSKVELSDSIGTMHDLRNGDIVDVGTGSHPLKYQRMAAITDEEMELVTQEMFDTQDDDVWNDGMRIIAAQLKSKSFHSEDEDSPSFKERVYDYHPTTEELEAVTQLREKVAHWKSIQRPY